MSGMKIIKPTPLTEAMLTSSTALEPGTGETVWVAGTAYTVGQTAIRVSTHRQYKRLVAGTTATAPESDLTNWLDVGPTNKWAMFDRKIGTLTTLSSPLSIVIRPGPVSGLGVIEVAGREAVITLKDAPGGTTVYSKTVDLDGTQVTSFYDWFYTEFEQKNDFVITDMPQHYTSGELTISITGTSSVSAGVLQFGKVIEVGDAQYGATIGILDFSRKERDDFGNIDVVERGYSKRINIKVITPKSDFNRLYRTMAGVRATPCIYITTEEYGYEPLIDYAFYKDFSIDIAYPDYHLCNIEIEGIAR